MSRHDTGRVQKHRAEMERAPREGLVRYLLAGGLVVLVLGAGLVFGFGDFFGRPEAGGADATPVRMSMAGFTPAVIDVIAGQDVSLELWTTDAAPHLEGGVHTMISEELNIYEELPAESRRTITISAPPTPGDYDIYCDTCCGGKDSPAMHGILRVRPA